MAAETLIIVVGGDYLAYEICREILKTAGHHVTLVWKHDDEHAARLLAAEARTLATEFGTHFNFCNANPNEPNTLYEAGLQPPGAGAGERTYCVVTVSQDDRLNLRVALMARDVNEHVRITIRQFNPLLGYKIQEGLKYNCTAISPAAHAAATYAAAAVDPSCFYALPFPTMETLTSRILRHRRRALEPGALAQEATASLFGFCERNAEDFGIIGMTVAEAESRLGARVVSVEGRIPYMCRGKDEVTDAELLKRRLVKGERVAVFGAVRDLKNSWERLQVRRGHFRERISDNLRDLGIAMRRTEPLLLFALTIGMILGLAFAAYFMVSMHLNPIVALYYVVTTMTTVGYGDVTPCVHCGVGPLSFDEALKLIVAMLAMVAGVTIFAIFTATTASALNAEKTRRLSGLRRIHRSGHVIVCGAGNVGSLVVEYLRELGERVVVVEKNPDSLLIELARDRKIDLLTGDATNDETIGYCSPEHAKSLIGVTNSDTANLEAALGVRTRTYQRAYGHLHSVLRIDDLAFGESIRRHFGISSFSTTELTAPTIAGLARFESSRGRFDLFAHTANRRTFQLAERLQGPENAEPPAPAERAGQRVQWIPLYVWRNVGEGKGVALPVHKFKGDVSSGDHLLFVLPLDQFSD